MSCACSCLSHVDWSASPLNQYRAVYAAIEPEGLVVTRYALTPLGWPADHRLSVAVIADLHAGGPDMQLPHVRHAIGVLGKRAQEGFIAGEAFSLADMYALPVLAYLNQLPESRDFIGETQTLGAYLDRHAERPCFKNTTPPPLANFSTDFITGENRAIAPVRR